mgnify:CR=1 FL=1
MSYLRIFPEPSVYPQAYHAKQRLAENTATHLACALTSVDEHYRNLLDLETYLMGSVFHLDLEGIALEAKLVEVDGLEHTATMAECREH